MTNQASNNFTNARIKLGQRHLLEWYGLIIQQQKVWSLLDEETAEKLSACEGGKVACFELKRQKALRLTKIIDAQRRERAQLKARHQNDFTLLENSRNPT